MSSNKQKMEYIRRHYEILTTEQNSKIYLLVKRSSNSNTAIRETTNNDIYLDLMEIKDPTIIDTIYTMVKDRKIEIKIDVK